MNSNQSFVFYAPGNFGLGQTVRAIRLAEMVAKHAPRSTITVITSIPHIQRLFHQNERLKFVVPKSLIALREELRRDPEAPRLTSLVSDATASIDRLFRRANPDALVTMSHRGLAGELAPLLAPLGRSGCRRVLALRDIYSPPQFRQDFQLLGPSEIDAVLVGATPEAERWLPSGLLSGPMSERVRYVGYVAPDVECYGFAPPPSSGSILCQVGGGRDGRALVEAVASAIEAARPLVGESLELELSTGPLMPVEDAARVAALASAHTRVTDWRPTAALFEDRRVPTPRLVISMSGYNSCVEAACSGVSTLLVPRIDASDREQEIRASLFSDWFPNIEVSSMADLQSQVVRCLASTPRELDLHEGTGHLRSGFFAHPSEVSQTILGG